MTLDVIEVEGKVIDKNKRDIYIDFPAVVQEIYVSKGILVQKGMPIITLDTLAYEVAIDIKAREIELYQVELKRLTQPLNPQLAVLGQLEPLSKIN